MDKAKHFSAAEIASKTFSISRKGFDQSEVRAFLNELSEQIIELKESQIALEKQIENLKSRQNQAPEISEEQIYNALGRQAAKILESANASAKEKTTEAETKAAAILKESETLLAKRSSEAEAQALQIIDAANKQAEAIVDTASNEQKGIIQNAKRQAEAIVNEANELKNTMIADLLRKRKYLRGQVEQLLAAKKALEKSIANIKAQIEGIETTLLRSDALIKNAAEAAQTKVALEPDPRLQELIDLAKETSEELHEEAGTDEENNPVNREGEPNYQEVSATEDFEGIKILGVIKDPENTKEARPSAQEVTESTPVNSIDNIFKSLKESQGLNNEENLQKDEISQDPTVTEENGNSEGRPNLGSFVALVSRKLKKTLSEEQNEILDSIRSKKEIGLLANIIDPNVQIEKYCTSVIKPLEEAMLVATNGTDIAYQKAVDKLNSYVKGAISEIVSLIRGELEKIDVSDLKTNDTTYDIGSVYRNWRANKLDYIAQDLVTAAYSIGIIELSEATQQQILWKQVNKGCSDCEDNALAGLIAPTDLFPTGQAHPPQHPGCQCYLVSCKI